MELNLENKNVLITGSTAGLGKAMAISFAQEGANVIITGRKIEKVQAVVDTINTVSPNRASGYAVDLSYSGEAERMFGEISKKVKVDILVNNAGCWPKAYVKDMEKDDFEKTIYLNLEVPYILSRQFVNACLENDRKGKIINVVSQAAFHGSTTGHAHYAASKGGLVSFMISLAREVAPYGINVNAIAPGMMRTAMVQSALAADEEYYKKRIPIGRVSEPEEIANIAVFLASSQADYLTGITVDATGGMLMR